jgi:hypothetical protein
LQAYIMYPLIVAITCPFIAGLLLVLYRLSKVTPKAPDDSDADDDESEFSQEIEETIAQYIKEQEDQFYDKLYSDINVYREKMYLIEERQAAAAAAAEAESQPRRRRNSL